MGDTMRKRDDLPGATRLEAQGLAWLAEAMPDGGAHTVPAVAGDGWIDEPRLSRSTVTPQAAEAFGRALAVTHAAGAPAFGSAPPGWDGRTQMGRCDIRLRPHSPDSDQRTWGEFYAEDRLAPYVRSGYDRGALDAAQVRLLEAVCRRLRDGELGEEQPALVLSGARERGQTTAVARTHGDLWCGNVLWVPSSEVAAWAPGGAGRGPARTPDHGSAPGSEPGSGRKTGPTSHPASHLDGEQGAAAGAGPGTEVVGVLIDPLAHGAHAETDLAALGVFGQRHLDRIVGAYNEVSPLAPGWRERVGLHQLHILMIHVHLFGGGYGSQAASVARSYA